MEITFIKKLGIKKFKNLNIILKSFLYGKKQILIIDNSGLSFTGDDINGPVLRGTETSLILLSEEFAKKILMFFATKTNQEKK